MSDAFSSPVNLSFHQGSMTSHDPQHGPADLDGSGTRDGAAQQPDSTADRCPLTTAAASLKKYFLQNYYTTFITPSPIDRGMGYCFRLISLFVSLFVCFFVSKITRKRLDRFA